MRFKFQLVSIIVFLVLTVQSLTLSANPILSVQREAYQLYLKSLKEQNFEVSQAQLLALKSYPLYRYAEYRLFLQFTDNITPKDIIKFIEAEPNSAVNQSLVAFFVNKWGKAAKFELLLALNQNLPLSNFKLTIEDRCFVGQALLDTGQVDSVNQIVNEIWLTGKSLPDACDSLVSHWQKNGMTDDSVLARLLLAIENKNISLAVYLSKLLPKEHIYLQKAIAAIQKTPNDLTAIMQLTPTPYTQNVSLALFEQLTRSDLNEAINTMPKLIKSQKLSETQKRVVEDALFKQLLFLNEPTSSQLKLRERFFETSLTDELIENRIRIALREDDWENVSLGIGRLSEDGKQKDTWIYFKAMDLTRRGGHDNLVLAEKLLKSLTLERGFYPMLAAQKLNIPYVLEITPAAGNKDKLINDPIVGRVKEFLYWQQQGQALREWIYLIERTPSQEQPYLARFALENGWHQLAVQATISAKLWNNIYERFPLGWYEIFSEQVTDRVVPKSYALAIARQESAWAPEVMSPAGAMGLMQVMPATAKQVASKNEIATFTDSNQLLRPEMNIKIGVQYLHDLLTDYGNNRILATAAYNAGPNRVKFWLNRTGGKVDSAQFIESISFPETRQYVKNVLSFDMYYRLIMKHNGLLTEEVGHILTEDELSGSF